MVSVEKIQKSYGKKTVLRDITMQAGPGECIGILGGNGSGKSTLLQILAGVTRPDGGKFLYEGKSLFGDSARRADRKSVV